MSSLPGRFAAALRFLTIFPLPGKLGTTQEELAGSLLFFPLVGVLIGGITSALAGLLQLFFPPFVTAVLVTSALAVFSGALHLDGLADSADGFFSSRPRERILEIMRDSSTGAMGVLTLVLLILCKVSCLDALVTTRFLLPAVFLMPLAGRSAILLLMSFLPYARPDGGLATLFYSRNARFAAFWALALCIGLAAGLAGARGIAAVLAVVALVFFFSLYCQRKIGGATGDTLGAVSELAEAMVALVFVCHLGGGA